MATTRVSAARPQAATDGLCVPTDRPVTDAGSFGCEPDVFLSEELDATPFVSGP